MRKRPRESPGFAFCDCDYVKKCPNQACFDNTMNAIMINPRYARRFPKVVDLVVHEVTHWCLEMYLDRNEVKKMTRAIPESVRAYRNSLPERLANEVEEIARVNRRGTNKR